jgi:transporter family-2 protein
MKGWIFAVLGGGFIALQGAANARIGADIGTWQAATITQFTGFVAALIIGGAAGGISLKPLRQVKPLYWFGGAFAAAVIYSNVTAIQSVGLTLTVASVLIAQLAMSFLVESRGWFGIAKQKMEWPQFIGIAMMIVGVIVLKSG